MKEIEEYMGTQPIHKEIGLHFCTKRNLNRKFHSTWHSKEALKILIDEGTIFEALSPKNKCSKLLFYNPLNETKDTV